MQCNLCDKSFTGEANLNRHIKAFHEGKKPFNCNICDASFAQKDSLNGHIADQFMKGKGLSNAMFVTLALLKGAI